tara:strand:+ start:128 stop:472 length:345 start_codon:yes stop_codon:yes gene_type:complete
MSQSIGFFYNSTYVYRIRTNESIEHLQEKAYGSVVDILRNGVGIQEQIQTYEKVLKGLIRDKRLNKKITRMNKLLGCFAVLNLLKFKRIKNDYDNGYIVIKNKSKNKSPSLLFR